MITKVWIIRCDRCDKLWDTKQSSTSKMDTMDRAYPEFFFYKKNKVLCNDCFNKK